MKETDQKQGRTNAPHAVSLGSDTSPLLLLRTERHRLCGGQERGVCERAAGVVTDRGTPERKHGGREQS